MHSVNLLITHVEEKWLDLLRIYVQSLYVDVQIPSHDLQHHLRVWWYCKKLLQSLSESGLQINELLVQEAIIACAFHDTGLIVDKSERHGKASRVFCEKFLAQQINIPEKSEKAILDAVEFHDDKSLKQKSGDDMLGLTDIVSTSDDLDAFGLIGVFRYIEIYAIRGISKQQIPQKVLDNIYNRFQNLKLTLSQLNDFCNDQELRYSKTREFFINLQNAIRGGVDNECVIKAFDFIYTGFSLHKFNFDEMCENAFLVESSQSFKNYFIDFKKELELHE
jgi:HD superfamily phosphodiesterase